jgi:hypothetical protein
LAHLDALKIVLTAAVIVAHAAMTYGAVGTWIYEEDSLSGALAAVLGALVGGGVMFVLGLFFLMAGVLTTGPLQRIGPGRFLRSRLVRLGVPVLVYALVVWPLLHWLIGVVVGDGPRSLLDSYEHEFRGSAWQHLGTGPMWFLEILLLATACWCLWRVARPAPSASTASAVVWRAVPVIALATFVVRLEFPIDAAQFLDLHVWLWPQAFVLFVVGALGAEHGWVAELPVGTRRQLRLALLIGAVVLAVLIVLSDGPDAFKGGWHWEAAGFAAFEGVWSIGMSLLLLDWARRHVRREGPLMRTLARAAFGAFVAQGPVLVAIALALRSAGLPGDIDFFVLAILGVTISFLVGGLAARARPRGSTGRQPTERRGGRRAANRSIASVATNAAP